MTTNTRQAVFLSIAIIVSIQSMAQFTYPSTKTADSTNTYFGITYHDPYQWLEKIETPEVQNWFKQQATYSDSVLNRLNGRDELVAELVKLDKIRPAVYRDMVYEGGRLFYRKTMPGESVGKIYYREGMTGDEVLLFDPLHYIQGKTLTVENFVPSFDGKQLAIGYAQQGSETSVLKIINVDTRQLLEDSLFPAEIEGWTFDNKAVFYSWIKSADNKDPASRLNSKTKLHVIGDDVANDKDFFSNESYPDLKIDPAFYPYASLNENEKNYIFASIRSVANELTLYYAPIAEINNPKIKWKVLSKPENALIDRHNALSESFIVKNGAAYAITYKNAKNYKVVATPLQHPDWNSATAVVPEEANKTVENIYGCKDYLLIIKSDGINNYLCKYNYSTKKTTGVQLPFKGSVRISVPDSKSNQCFVAITSWVKPHTEFSYDAITDKFTPGTLNKPFIYPDVYNDLVVDEVEVKGHDGVLIPLSIIHKKDIKMDGANPCLMEGYGAYGISITSGLDIRENALAVQGAVIAIAHIRGGGEKGDAWYKAGYQITKPNTWKDFISCAEYLIEKGYTASRKIAGKGTSAGGILISRAITERPDLFAAAICNVGCANAMRLEFGANGPVNIPEFGTVKDSIQCKALYEMDGMQHVVKGVNYPAVMCVAGWNDSRVIAWEPGKFAAALQNASTSGKPVLMKVNYDNGHFTEDKTVTYKNFADMYAFVMWQCGHPRFQPKK